MADKAISWMDNYDDLPSADDATTDEDTYVDVMRQYYQYKREVKGYDVQFDEQEWRVMYRYLQTPDDLHALVLDHMTMMWERFLEAEWKKRKPILEESVKAHAAMDYSGMSPYEVIEAVTGRDMRDAFSDIINRSKNDDYESVAPCGSPLSDFMKMKKNRIFHLFFPSDATQRHADGIPGIESHRVANTLECAGR